MNAMSDIARKTHLIETRTLRDAGIRAAETRQTWILAGLVILPLVMVLVQLALKLDGVVGYSLYKILFLVPPLIYCRMRGISVIDDVLRPGNWRNCLPAAIGLGLACGAIFLSVYFVAIDWIVERSVIVERMGSQFSVTAATVALVAPITILLNSLLEEFFYRGFAFGRLVGRQRILGQCLPAAAFSIQHLLFISHWLSPGLLALAGLGLFVFAWLLQVLYEKADTIVAPWVVHILADLAMMTIALELLW
ncbi:MAG: CPBP family intramembrane glutamic endopeptidase [Planctomycetota bacterium]|nr:CPBP family intramembrane glutamic endopeptidase [Planctomycetota bacterium]